jgi:two-component system, sensor histidine kinase RegB
MVAQSQTRAMPSQVGSAFAIRHSSSQKTATGCVRLRTLVLIRWIAVFGQTVTILFVYFVLGYDLPIVLSMATVGASVALNIVATVRYPYSRRLSDTEAVLYLGYDALQLTVLLFLTGGLHNPFSVLMVAAVTISATILSVRSTVRLGTLSIVCVSVLMFFHFPLPWPGGEHALSHLYVFGIWTSLVIGMVFLSICGFRVAEEGRRMSDALTETQMALAREHRISAVGGLAAAAAHELGTPLSTVALIAKEMSRELPADSPHTEDLKLLISQSDRCRDILARLTLSPENESGSPFYRLPLVTLIEAAAHSYHRKGISVDVEIDSANAPQGKGSTGDKVPGKADQPMVLYSLEIVHGLENLFENAVDFANSWVSVRVGWSESEARIEIADDGPGFSRDILGALGEPYVSTRRDSGGMGLGVFIAKTLLERTGAGVEFGNRHDGGARIEVTWPRPVLEAEGFESTSEAHDPSDRAEDSSR